ncbi:MAG: acetate--CoA ligase family protein, partial [Firmicutes bacterium]|nr:acetate--CoA ligase family protein [Bacillota bacterium]
MNLHHLLRPKVVAIVGASEKLGFGRDVSQNMLACDLGDNLYFVNPNREQVLGKKCYKSISDIGRDIDLVIICTPMFTVNNILEEAAGCGCKGAVIFASGYGEAGEEGKLAQEELKNLATKHGIAVCGPNCAGFINNVDNIHGFGLPVSARQQKGNIGLVAQSGQVCSLLVSVPHLKFSYAISSGNNAVVGIEDYLEFLVEDEATEVIAVYLEGVKYPEKFARVLAQAAKKRKPIIALKVGASEKARQTTTAHTGSLAGSDAAFGALFKKFGVVRVHDMEELINACVVMSTLKKKPPVNSVAILNISGGEAAISADMAQLQGVRLAEFSPETLQKLQDMLPGYATPNNPLDMTATLVLNHDKYRATLRTVMADPDVGMLVIGLNPPELVAEIDKPVDYGLARSVIEVNNEGSKPIVLMPGMSRKRDPELREFYYAGSVPIVDSPMYGLSVIKKYAEFSLYDPSARTLEVAVGKDGQSGEKVSTETLSEHGSKAILKEHGISVPEEYVAQSEAEALKAAKAIGYPLVLKIDSPDIPHKTDIGGVKLGIDNDVALKNAFNEIMDNAKRHKPDARVNGVLV